MIEVRLIAVIERHVFQVAVVKILLDEDDFVGTNGFENRVRNRRLA